MYSAKLIWEILLALDFLWYICYAAYVGGRRKPIVKVYNVGHYAFSAFWALLTFVLVFLYTV